MQNKDELKKMLLTFYKESSEYERNLGSRKNQLISNSIFGLTFLLIFITFIISQNIIQDLKLIIITGLIILIALALFVGYIIYVIFLNYYQKNYLITSVKIEKKLFELMSKKMDADNAKELLFLFPKMRFINKLRLLEEENFKRWFIRTLKHQKEYDLKDWLENNIK